MRENAETLLHLMQGWVDAGALRPLDLALSRFIYEQGPEPDTAVVLATALTSERNGHGHVCLDLKGALEQPSRLLTRLRDDVEIAANLRTELRERLAGLELTDWVSRLAASAAVRDRLGGADDDQVSPLVLEGTADRPLLYLRRYWRYEQRILSGIIKRLQRRLSIPEAPLKLQLTALFDADADAGPDAIDWQKIACALAARSAFAIITGGPGTGKTTTVVRLLALLQGLALDPDQGTSQGPDQATRQRSVQGLTQDRARHDHQRHNRLPLRIHLAAPTGKAAARLNESIAGRVASLRLDHLSHGEVVRAAIPTEVTTLHRLLGAVPDSRHFRHHAGNPLASDLVVVDEASMVDVEMMSHLLDALRPDARLILLGDKDQLASVEAGAVLGDLCQYAARPRYSQATQDWIGRVTGATLSDAGFGSEGALLDQAIAMLRKSYRFDTQGGIGALAALVNADGDATLSDRAQSGGRLEQVQRLFEQQRQVAQRSPRSAKRLANGSAKEPAKQSTKGRIEAIQLRDADDVALASLVRDGYRCYLAAMQTGRPEDDADQPAVDAWAKTIIHKQGGFQLLTALRRGPWGVDGLNQRVIEILLAAGLLPELAQKPLGSGMMYRQWFAGRPVLVTSNDYSLRLMNGDIGITLSVPAETTDGQRRRVLRVAFPAGDGTDGIRWVLPSRLQSVETVFAMTVHKSQGSEFDHAALVLPDRSNPVLTRELIYTGITRAKEGFTLLYSQAEVLGHALHQRVQRVSGIRLSAALQVREDAWPLF